MPPPPLSLTMASAVTMASAATPARDSSAPSVYVAGKFSEKKQAAEVAIALEARGFAVPCKWWEVESKPAARGTAESKAVGDWELSATTNTDVMVCFFTHDTYPYKGTLCEMGQALGIRAGRRATAGQRPNLVLFVTHEGKTAETTVVLRVPHVYCCDDHITIAEGAPWAAAVDDVVRIAHAAMKKQRSVEAVPRVCEDASTA